MVRRHELTAEAWARIAPLLPPDPRRGQRWRDHRAALNGILWKLSTGVPRRDLPGWYGPRQTCHARLVRWQRDGTRARLLGLVRQRSVAVGDVTGEVSADSTVVRARQHAAGAPGKGGRPGRPGAPGAAAAG